MSGPLIEAIDLTKSYRLSGGWFAQRSERPAVAGVSFAIQSGRSFGIVGESGSGKSTIARMAMALAAPSSGEILLEGRSLFSLSRQDLKAARKDFQMIFQDPYGSLDPRMSVARVIAEPLSGDIPRGEKLARIAEALAAVGLDAGAASKYPHEFSGGQRQRIAIARALITRPKLVVADEPVSALDVSIQAQVLNLMSDLQRDSGVTYLLISHDLAVVGHICDEIAVMFRGRFVETGPATRLLSDPAHPYTRELLDAAPKFEESRHTADRLPPLPNATTGCPYAARCLYAQAICVAEAPVLAPVSDGVRAACHFPLTPR